MVRGPSHERIDSIGADAIKRVLVVQTAFIGDVVLTTPLVREAKRNFAKASVSVVCIPSVANILETNPYIDELIVYDKRGSEAGFTAMMRLARRLRLERFDLALLPHRSYRTSFIAWVARIPQRIGFDRGSGFLLYTQRAQYRPDAHEIERNLDLLRIVDGTIQSKAPEVFPDQHDKDVVDNILSQLKPERRMVALAPGSVWATKRWLAERFTSLASKITDDLDAEVILIGGLQDKELCERIAARTKDRVLNCAGQLTLRQSAEIISRCDVLMTNDSAPMHLAVAVGTRVLAIFGPTVPEFGFRPFGDGHVVVQKDLTCRPCRIHGGPKCPIGTHECMRAIRVEEVYEQVESMMSR